ncbi:hypothetical protein [Clostridium septicum]|uniref:SHOCT domain-containing protein n=1 Tax=Clostridium septicum TaxID=1504 RepID=A0A9N7JI64_CLOSE|nr:hypothetical protein [Clostridium septicum]AYE32998.1 hypothetical protein CP523_00295 [Clostridium septicum]QAS61135.1 hypothetical protein EI377_10590 [Clostridium septicum]UEC19486.1 hypothetical protein LK444_08610 [Clostridium septicum]USR99561.1 hypothetical protein NH397_08575 [Clostridium septicum]WLF68037.1 hypothetical protein Q6375_08565 [Clostridium septicum]
MKKRLLTSLVLTTMVIGSASSRNVMAVECKPNSLRVSCEISAPKTAANFDEFWTPENEGFLTSDGKEKIHSFRERVEKGERLSEHEKHEIKELKAEVIKTKLGEQKFNELQKLIEKREGSTDLTLEERARLYELDKEATGK